MKVDITDIIWAAVSMFIIGYSFHTGMLLYGFVAVYVLMALLFIYHIGSVRKRTSNSVAVYGMVTGYHKSPKGLKKIYPIVTYKTEDGRSVTSVYTVADTEERYELHSEEMICYDPADPMFFYFSNREDDLTRDYYRYIRIGGVIAAILLVIALIHG